MNKFDTHLQYLEKRERISMHINWTKPVFSYELQHFDQKVENYLATKGISLFGEDEIKRFLSFGEGRQIDLDSSIRKKLKNFSLTYSQFKKVVKEPGYSDNYNRIEQELRDNGAISLPMPIIIDLGDEYYGFAGNLRMNLARWHDIPITFWVVKARG